MHFLKYAVLAWRSLFMEKKSIREIACVHAVTIKCLIPSKGIFPESRVQLHFNFISRDLFSNRIFHWKIPHFLNFQDSWIPKKRERISVNVSRYARKGHNSSPLTSGLLPF